MVVVVVVVAVVMNLVKKNEERKDKRKKEEQLCTLTSAHCTRAMKPLFCSSIQFASYSLGPIRKLRS